MELVEICPLDTWKALEDEIHRRSGLSASVFDTEGVRIIPIKSWPSKLCAEIKANPKGQSFICAAAHMNIALMAKEKGGPVSEECDAGMIKMVVPITVRYEFVGSVSGCGLLLDDGEVDTFLVNKITGIDEDYLNELSEGVPALTTAQANDIGQFIQDEVTRIVSEYEGRDKT